MSQVEVIVGIIGAFGAVLAASVPYYLSKKSEISLDIQKTKLERYDDLLQKFVMFLRAEAPQGSRKEKDEKYITEFIMAYQRASSYASTKVLAAVEDFINFRERTPDRPLTADEARKISTEPRIKINSIFKAIREDIYPKEREFDFQSLFWKL